MTRLIRAGFVLLLAAGPAAACRADHDLGGYQPDCGVSVRADDTGLDIQWPAGPGRGTTRLILDADPARPLIRAIERDGTAILEGLDPVLSVTVGTRVSPKGRPPGMDPFNVFFDSPAQRPHETFAATTPRDQPRSFRVTSHGRRATVSLAGLTAGPFAGDWRLTLSTDSPLVRLEAAVRTDRPATAFLYDLGLTRPAAAEGGGTAIAWMDTEGALQRGALGEDRRVAVRHRAILAETPRGALAIFPPPHQFFFPRDYTNNLETAWFGRGHRGVIEPAAFGIGQAEAGGGAFSPWFNAPPGTVQHLGAFLLPGRGDAAATLLEVLRYTNNDRFVELPGHLTFTSHWHLARAVEAMKEQAEGGLKTPEFVAMFKDMGVRIVHLAEFHGDGHPRDPGPQRRAELKAMFDECRRLSDDAILFLPGEEANIHLAPTRSPGHPGHWLYLFPRPVAWLMSRPPDQPFRSDDPEFGTLYRVGDRAEMLRLLEAEHGLAWTAHPRIKASSWSPDHYRQEDFFRSDRWLGAAWKAMPADLSREKLGERALDLLDDMANWGGPKYLPGEVDVFKLDHTHELYGHMNINYLKLDRLPRYGESWQPILDALRSGRFFVTTGEVLIQDFTVGGQESGRTIAEPLPELVLKARLSWTFPPMFAEIVTGDGATVHRRRIDLSHCAEFQDGYELAQPLELSGQRWVRLEVWDVAGNGAFTQPVWIAPGS